MPPKAPGAAGPLPRTSLLAMVLLTFLTFGLYLPWWLLSRADALNALAPPPGPRVSKPTLIAIAPLFAASTTLSIIAEVRAEAGVTQLDVASTLLSLAGSLILILQTLRARALLETWRARERPDEPPLSRVWTVILVTFYLQWRVNPNASPDAPPPQG